LALSANTVFEVRTTGSDSNGGGFVTGASGTDYSQQDAAQYALTGLTTAAANAIILTASAAAVMVGNLINITGGTNFTTGIYQITAVSVGVSITVDRNCTTAAGAAGTANVGGALLTVGAATAIIVEGSITWVKTGTYSISAGITFANSFGTGYQQATRLVGYGTTRGDTGRPTIQASAGSFTLLTVGSGKDGASIENLILDGNSQTSAIGLNVNAGSVVVTGCKIMGCPGGGILTASSFYGNIQQCEVTTCGTAGISVAGPPIGIQILNNYIHDNTAVGVTFASGATIQVVVGNVIANNTGASSDGLSVAVFYVNFIHGNVFYGNGRDGIRLTNQYPARECVQNNIFVSNGGYGINSSSAPTKTYSAAIAYNAFYNNTSGARNNIATGVGDVTLTSDPFVASGSGNFALNNTAGAGAACRAAGFPGAFPGGTTTGYADIGAVQHQDSGGASGGFVFGG